MARYKTAARTVHNAGKYGVSVSPDVMGGN